MHAKYCVQPGIIDAGHLELVALVKVTRDSWMPHFRLIAPSRGNGVYVPQMGCRIEASHSFTSNQNSVWFVLRDGSHIPVTAALEGDYTGLVNRDLPAFGGVAFTITLRLQVNRSYHLRDTLVLIGYTVAGVSTRAFPGELTDLASSERG